MVEVDQYSTDEVVALVEINQKLDRLIVSVNQIVTAVNWLVENTEKLFALSAQLENMPGGPLALLGQMMGGKNG